jgi:hypothetical protein
MTKDEALKMAIDAMQSYQKYYMNRAINACKEALDLSEKQYTFPDKLNIANCDLKQPAQEPVAWMDEANNTITTVQLMKYGWLGSDDRAIPDAWIKLYTHSTPDSTPAHQWQGLTDDEVDDFMFQSCDAENGYSITDLIRLVEQALKEKNHG